MRLLGKEEKGFGRRGGEAVGVCMVVVHGGYPRPAQDDHLCLCVCGRETERKEISLLVCLAFACGFNFFSTTSRKKIDHTY